jgi:hypothetical protein
MTIWRAQPAEFYLMIFVQKNRQKSQLKLSKNRIYSISHLKFKTGLNIFEQALQKPGFFPEIFREFLGGQVFCGRKPVKRYTCPQANLSNNKITKKDSFLKSFPYLILDGKWYYSFAFKDVIILSLKNLVKIFC